MKSKSEKKSYRNTSKYAVFGLMTGLIFPVAATLLSARNVPVGLDFGSLLSLHLTEPLLQIIDLAPPVLFFAGLFLGIKTDKSLKILDDATDEKFKSLIEHAVEVIYITNYKGNFIYFNESIFKIYGYKPEELVGSHFTVLIKPSMINKVAAFYLNQFEKRIPETISDFQIVDKSGNPRWVEQTVTLRMKDNRVEGFQCVVRDIDNRIQQEQKIQDLNTQLTNKLKELEGVNLELSAFNHTVSHDLRSPLRGISTLAEIMQMEFQSHLPEEAQGLLSRIVTNTTKIQKLVEDLLEFSKIGKQEILKEQVNMQELVDQILTEHLPNDPENKTSVQIDALSDSFCDKQLVNQVWINFISNALKYSANKENPLIRIGNYFKNDEQVYFVKDNGAGFDMKYYKKLFGVFSRLHTDAEFNGTGVGLSIVKRIVERHGGKVWAEGQTGLGATFYFSLPVIKNDSSIKTKTYRGPVFHS
jgi:PAS domain S-box-containing protein